MTEKDTKSGFSAQEREAMKQRAEELRNLKGVKGSAKKVKEFEACVAAIEALEGTDRAVAERLHVIVLEEAPDLDPKTWYGFPTYARDGKNIVFYQPAEKFGTRYGCISFEEHAALDDGDMWPIAFAVNQMTEGVESRVRDLVRQAIS
ncbi:iron chaperone [Populibacterium corticicola]|uniref:Iron chaperone n=1 Tax=Populibacterium corticicola TaxID=1812826 RepID=A0ABW5XGL0_9MICO